MNENLSKKISIYNFVFTMCIVIYHWKNFHILFSEKQLYLFDKLYTFYDNLGYISLGIFFMISGYLFYLGIDNRETLVKKIKRRLFSLGVPFIVWNTLMLAYYILHGFYSRTFSFSVKDIILGFSFFPFNGPFWYIFALLLLMGVSPLVLKTQKYKRAFFCILIIVYIGAYLWGTLIESNSQIIGWISRLIYYIPAYMVGAYFGICKSDAIINEKYNVKVTTIIARILSVLFILYFVVFDLDVQGINWIILHGLPITIWLSFSNKMFNKVKINYFIKNTFFVYAMHAFVISVINTIIIKIAQYNSMHYIISFVLHFVCIGVLCLTCTCFALVARKILPSKIFGMLTGGRVE